MIMKRRELLGTMSIMGMGVLLSGFLEPLFGFLQTGTRPVLSETRAAMGTLLQISLVGERGSFSTDTKKLLDFAFAEAGRLEALLTRHTQGSPLYRLNVAGHLAAPPAELRHVLAGALQYCRESWGFFDPAVLSGSFPSSNSIRLGDAHISLGRHGIELTLDGIAKGFIVDRLSQLLRANGANNHLINAGGDIIARGVGPTGSGWKIGVQDPEHQGRLLSSFFLRDGAVATSGNYESVANRGKNHIFRPGTDKSADGMLSVSFFASTAMEADAMSTALFAMPVETLNDYIVQKKDASGLIVHKNGLYEQFGTPPIS